MGAARGGKVAAEGFRRRLGEVEAGFELLLEELQACLDAANAEGREALERGDVDKAKKAVAFAAFVQRIRREVGKVRQRWRRGGRRASGRRRRGAPGKRLTKGLATPRDAFRLPILTVLGENGGRAPVAEVMRRLEEMLGATLSDHDRERRQEGSLPRWRKSVHWCRLRLVQEGLVASGGWGVWALTEKGRREIEGRRAEREER